MRMQAREETEEAIQSGNHRYNSMLHDSMNKQDNLNRQIDALKLKIAGKAGEVRDLETQMSSLRIDAEEFKSRQLKSWEEERNAASAQRDQVRFLACCLHVISATPIVCGTISAVSSYQ